MKRFWKNPSSNFIPAKIQPPSKTEPKQEPPAAKTAAESPDRVRLLEEISLNAWPAFHTSLYDGWVIRFADGFSRRSNSIVPLYPSRLDVTGKIRLCEAMCRGRGQRTIFKLTAASDPPELDLILSDEGYRSEAETGVRTFPLKDAPAAPGPDVTLEEAYSEEWVSALETLNAYDPRHHQTLRTLTQLIAPPRVFASVRRGGRIAACGLGVVRQGFLAVFDIVVDAGHRRQGLGRQMMQSLLHWGAKESAATAFLQVMANNPVAEEMYTGLGFKEEYRYIYWAKD